MKFALIDGQRREAQPDLTAKCLSCDHPMVAICGSMRIWHWRHKGRHDCDPWWENETEWHRNWKNQFPIAWQEIDHQGGNGEKHRADIKTDQGWVIEFQHSFLTPEERQSRDHFYQNIVWVVDGKRRKRDEANFSKFCAEGWLVSGQDNVRRLPNYSDECALIREWVGSSAPIFFDFGGDSDLWYFLPTRFEQRLYVRRFPREMFIGLFLGTIQIPNALDFFVNELPKMVADYDANRLQQMQNLNPITAQTLPRFRQYFHPQQRYRRRF